MLRQPLSTVRSCAGSPKSGLVSSNVGFPVRELVARRRDQRHAPRPGVVHRALRRLDDGALLGLLLGAISRVRRAVVQPRIDVIRHVDHVDADVPGIGERVHRRLEQEEPGVLPRADVDEVDLRRHARHAETIQGPADRGRDVRAVAAVVLIHRVDARRVLARPVVDARHRVVGDEVPVQRPVEVRRDVRMAAVDARVQDAHAHRVAALLAGIGARRPGADELHVPLQARQRVAVDRLVRARPAALEAAAFALDVAPARLAVGCAAHDRVGRGRAVERGLGAGLLGEGRIARAHRRHPDVGVLLHDRSARVADCLMGRGGAGPLLVHDDVVVGHRRGRAHGEDRAGAAKYLHAGHWCAWTSGAPYTASGDYVVTIMPAPTVSFVASSMRMNEPVARLRA
jgi:hypothetical protein